MAPIKTYILQLQFSWMLWFYVNITGSHNVFTHWLYLPIVSTGLKMVFLKTEKRSQETDCTDVKMEYVILLDRTVRQTDTNFRFYLYNLHNTTGHTVTYISAYAHLMLIGSYINVGTVNRVTAWN